MGFQSNRTILEKADMAIRDLQDGGGYLLPAQAQKFMRLLIKQSELMGMATVVPMASPRQQTPKIKFGQRVLRAGKEGTRLADKDAREAGFPVRRVRRSPVQGGDRPADETLEDSVERGELRQTIMELITEAIGPRHGGGAHHGRSPVARSVPRAARRILVQTVSHVVDAGGANLTKDILFDTVRTFPSEYLRVKKTSPFLTSVDTELGYRNTLAERATIGGDKWLETDVPVMYSGIPIRSIPLFPENLPSPVMPPPRAANGGPPPVVPIPRNRTTIVLANPKNIQVGIWRKVRIETWRDVSAGVLRMWRPFGST